MEQYNTKIEIGLQIMQNGNNTIYKIDKIENIHFAGENG